jgi:hypothetical protein
MRELEGSPIDNNSYELVVLQGLRALLGEDKAQRAMVGLQSDNPAACEQVMAEAQARYDALSPEQKEDPSRILSKVIASSANLKFKMVVKAAPKGIFTSIPKLPKVIKSFFIKQ